MARDILQTAAALGAVAGLRTFTAPFFTGVSRQAQTLQFPGTSVRVGDSSVTAGVLVVLAFGELIADKLPGTPSRLEPPGLLFRMVSGGVCGAAVFAANEKSPSVGAIAGAAAAVCSAFLGYHIRHELVRRGVPDFVCAVAEDAIALGGALEATRALR